MADESARSATRTPKPARRLRGIALLLLPLLLGGLPVRAQWTQVAFTGPSPRGYSGLVEAPGLGQTILFGGLTGDNSGTGQGDT